MDKSPEAFRTISEVADALRVPPHVLRFWESRFAQVKPVKRGGGRRYYRPEDVRLLRGIRGLLYDDGMTIKGVQKILRERGIRHVIGLGTLPDAEEAAEAAAVATPEPVSAPAAKTARPARARSGAEPQADLFAGAADTTLAERKPAPAATSRAKPAPADRKGALKALVSEFEALRAVMIASPDD